MEYKEVTAATLPDAVAEFAEAIQSYDIPSDGLVLLMDDIAYGDALGRTAKFPRNSIAFKWADEIRGDDTPGDGVECIPNGTDQSGGDL